MTLGTGNKKRANELFSMLVCATAVLGVIFTVVALLVLRPAAVLLGATAELLDDCILYGTIITVFQTAFMLQFLFQSFFITAEKPKLGLFFTVAAGLTNMVLDFVFVGVMGLGITGAAAATVISQLIGGIGPMFYFARPGNGSLLHFVRPVFSGKALLKACTNGSSELMTNLSASLVGALYNWQLLRLGGADGVAAYGVIMYVSFIFAAIFIGYAQGCAPVVSYHYGADNTDELKNLLRISLRVIAVGGVAMLCFSELLAAPLSRFFVGYDAELLELTTLAMSCIPSSFLALSVYLTLRSSSYLLTVTVRLPTEPTYVVTVTVTVSFPFRSVRPSVRPYGSGTVPYRTVTVTVPFRSVRPPSVGRTDVTDVTSFRSFRFRLTFGRPTTVPYFVRCYVIRLTLPFTVKPFKTG